MHFGSLLSKQILTWLKYLLFALILIQPSKCQTMWGGLMEKEASGRPARWRPGKLSSSVSYASRCLRERWVNEILACLCALDMKERCTRLSWAITRAVKDLWCWRTLSWRRCCSTWRRTWSQFWVQRNPVSKQSRQRTALNRSKVLRNLLKSMMRLNLAIKTCAYA